MNELALNAKKRNSYTERGVGIRQNQIYETLKKEIVERVLLPKQQLIEAELAKRFAVSRTPVRQALQQLAVEGFVEWIPYRGAFVKKLSPEELKELFQVRMALERLAAQLFCTLPNEELLDRLRENLQQAKSAVEKRDVILYAKLDEQFHDLIMDGSNNNEAKSIAKTLNQKTAIFRLRSFALPEQMETSLKEHQQIFHCLKEKDAKAASEMAEKHVKGVLEKFYEFLKWEEMFK